MASVSTSFTTGARAAYSDSSDSRVRNATLLPSLESQAPRSGLVNSPYPPAHSTRVRSGVGNTTGVGTAGGCSGAAGAGAGGGRPAGRRGGGRRGGRGCGRGLRGGGQGRRQEEPAQGQGKANSLELHGESFQRWRSRRTRLRAIAAARSKLGLTPTLLGHT